MSHGLMWGRRVITTRPRTLWQMPIRARGKDDPTAASQTLREMRAARDVRDDRVRLPGGVQHLPWRSTQAAVDQLGGAQARARPADREIPREERLRLHRAVLGRQGQHLPAVLPDEGVQAETAGGAVQPW